MGMASVVVRFGVAALFLVSGAAKARRLVDFEGAVRAYRLLPPSLSKPVSRAVPLIETFVGVALAVGLRTRFTASVASLLLGVLAIAMVVNLARGRRIDCGCLGIAEHQRISWRLVCRNLLLMLVTSFLVIGPLTALSFDEAPATLTTSETWAIALPALMLPMFVLILASGLGVIRAGRTVLGGAS